MKRILIADDEEILRMLMVDSLEDEGYEIDEAEDGLDAIGKLDNNDYDLLLVDYMMPGATGLEVIEHVRKGAKNSRIKIVMLTAKTQKEDEERAKSFGANFFLGKPFSPNKLVGLIGEIFNDKES